MAGSLQPRIKTWVSTEDVIYSDLNAEFDNCLTAMQPLLIDDYSTNAAQMQVTTDPGEVGSESLATTLAGEIARLRHMIGEITGENEWYESPISSLAGLANAVGTGLTDNRLVSGRRRSDVSASLSAQPVFLVPNGAARTVKLDGTPVNFLYFVEGVQYTISSDVTLTNLTAAPSSQNTCLINDTVAADQYWTKYAGEDGSEIPVDNMGTEITALVGKFAGFKLDNGSASEYFIAYVNSGTRLTKARRGYFFDSSDNPIPRVAYANNDTITLMKLTWMFLKSDGTLTATYNNPVWSDDEPTSPAVNDYWFDTSANKWKKYDVASYIDADAMLIGICLQDTSNTVAARSFDFFANFEDINTVELLAESNTQVKSRFVGSTINVYGQSLKYDYGLITWDMTLDLESGLTEASSTYYYFYITETGDKVISDKKPHDRRADLQGYYHPDQSWRCVGWAFNNASSNLEQVESYYRTRESHVIRSVVATDQLLTRDRVIVLSGASFTEHLPAAALVKGNTYTFYHSGTSFSQVYTLDGFGSETIEGSTTVILHTNGQMLKIMSDGTNWIILSSKTRTGPQSISSPESLIGGFGTPTAAVLWWERDGSYLRMWGSFLSGTPSGTGAITLLGSQSLNTSVLGFEKTMVLGTWYGGVSTAAVQLPANTRGIWPIGYRAASATSVFLTNQVDKDGDVTGTYLDEVAASSTTASGEAVMFDFKVPVVGWLP